MQRVAVDFGGATYSHSTANLDLHARATASLQTACPRLCRKSRPNAHALLLEDLWVRLRHPLRIAFALTGPSQIACDFRHASKSDEGLLPSLSAAAFWSQLGFDVVHATCDQASDVDVNADACSRIEIHLDRSGIQNSHGQELGLDALEHDLDDINCPSSTLTATLTEIWLQLDFEPSDQYERRSAPKRHAALVAMVDAALRDLLGSTIPRLMAGVRRGSSYACNLQDIFPAIFCPGRSKAISDRLRLISSVSQSITKCKRKSKTSDFGYPGSSLAQAPEETACRTDAHHDDEGLENSLFMGLVHNTGNAKGPKALKSLSANRARGNVSMQLSEAPDDDLASFHPLDQRADACSISLFFEDQNESVQDLERTQDKMDSSTGSEIENEVAAGFAATTRSSPAFEDLAGMVAPDGTLPEDCEHGISATSQSRNEASFYHGPSSSVTDQQPILDLEDDVSMLREPLALAEEAEARFSFDSSTSLDLIGEDDRLTQSWTRHSPPDDCSIRTSFLGIEEILHTPTASNESDNHKSPFLDDDVFSIDSHRPSRGSSTAKPGFFVESLEVVDDNSSASSSSDLEIGCLSQELQVPMSSNRDEDLTLAELLGDAKFSPEMWIRRRSTVMHSIPSAYVPASPTRSLGSGWSLKSPNREIREPPSPPTTAYVRECRQPPVVEEDHRPIFSKRSSTSSSSSAPQSPAEPNPHRRDSLLKRWSKTSKTSSDQEMLDLDLSQIDKRAVEVKRRKTMEDYEMQDANNDEENEDDMLFA